MPQLKLETMSDAHLLEAARQLARTDLKYLCTKILGFKDWDVFHDELVDWMNHSKRRFKMILMPRETFKSSIITIGKSIQDILQNPNVSIMYASAVLANSESFLSQTRDYLTSKSNLRHLFGEFRSEVWNSERIIVNQRTVADKTPTITPSGVDKTVVSQHYDRIYGDDLVNRQTVNTKEQIEKTRRYYSDSMDLLKKPDGILYLVGTRWDDKDLYGDIQRVEEELDAVGKSKTFDIYIRKVKEGTRIIMPGKFNQDVLDDLKQKKGSYDFSCQYMNEPVSREDQHFKPPVRYWSEETSGGFNFMTVDLAGEDEDADYNVVTDMEFSKANQLHVMEYDRGHYSAGQMVDKIFDMVTRRKPQCVFVEAVAYQRVFLHLLNVEMQKRKVSFPLAPVIPHKDKFSRIMALQPWWEQGNILLKPGMSELEEEFDRFPRALHDDILDTVAMAVPIVHGTIPTITITPEYQSLEDPLSRREWEAVEKRFEPKKKSLSRSIMSVGR